MNAEILSFFSLIVCFTSIFFLFCFYGKSGLFVYTSIIAITSNIQVLRLTQYSFMESPVALGTVAFSTIFAVDNILTEFFGAKEARKNVLLSFFCYSMFVCLMRIVVFHPVVQESGCTNLHAEMEALFSPSFVILISSLISYVSCQLFDIGMFSFLKKLTRGKYLGLRALLTMSCSVFLDNAIFSTLAWVVFADNPISWKELWSTYIFATYLLRLFIAVLCIPLIKLIEMYQRRREHV